MEQGTRNKLEGRILTKTIKGVLRKSGSEKNQLRNRETAYKTLDFQWILGVVRDVTVTIDW